MKNVTLLLCLFMHVCLIGQSDDTSRRTSPITSMRTSAGITKDMRCNTMPALDLRLQNDKEYRLYQNEAMSIKTFADQSFIPCDGTNTIVVPVAFHFSPGAVSCADEICILAEVQDQLDALNAAFGNNTGTGAEAVCPSAYEDAAGNSVASTGTCISFCLAVPPGGTADGLTPDDPPITIGAFDGGFNAGGNGAPGWDGILNIFVTQGNCLGVADGIPGQANGDGVTVCAQAFGGLDPSSCASLDTDPTYDLGATLIHEIGHYLGLFHTHVDGPFDCNIDNDVNAPGPFLVNDTPIQPDPTFGCPTGCIDDPGCAGITNEPTANFMAYTDDACMSMFTEDQAAVMNFWARELFDPMASVCRAIQDPATVTCVLATCSDGIQNGSETGVDCGGPDCPACETCMAGLDELINENFDACVIPAGWTVTATDGGTADITFSAGPNDVPGGGAGPPSDFSGCIALIDDDANDAIGVGCIITPIIDLSIITGASVTFDWQNNDFAGTGDFVVEVFDGSVWVQEFIEEEDNFGTNQVIDLSAYTNPDFQIRFCYDDEGEFAWGAGIDNVAVCGVATPMCPVAVMPTDISGSYCDGSDETISADPPNGNVTYTWTSSNPNVVFVDPTAASTSVEMSALTACQIETAEISLVAICDLDGSELFNGVVSTVMVYPAPPADLSTLVIVNPDTCEDPVLVDPNCAAFVTLTPDAGNPTFPVAFGDSGTAAYTITYASPAGAPDCCPVPTMSGDDELIIGGAAATQNTDGDLEVIGATGASMVWTSTSTNFGSVLCDTGSCGAGAGSVNYGVAPNSAAWLAWFGGAGGALEIGTLETDVIISTCDGGAVDFSFAYENSLCGSAADFIELQVDGTVLWSDDADPATCGVMGAPMLVTVDLSAFADGASHNILFTATTGSDGESSNFTVDNVILATTGCNAMMGEDVCVDTISSDYNCVAPVVEEIPTMGEWGLMILGLLFLIVSVVAIREQKQIVEKA